MAKGLGRGMGALLGEDAMMDEKSSITRLPLAKLEPRRDQPRTNFDQEKLEELAESIREHGLIQPITVRPVSDGFYQIIAGERRWRAARKAGLYDVPVNIIDADDRETEELALIENLQREDLNPIEEARGYQQLMKKFDLTQEQVADRVGKSRPVVANSLRLLRLPDAVIVLTESGKLSLSHARALLEVKDPQWQTDIAIKAVDEGLSVREVTELAKRKPKKNDNQNKPPYRVIEGIDYMWEVEEELTKLFGRKIRIDAGKDRGAIKMEYYDRDDFENLITQLREIKKVSKWNKTT